MRPRLKLPDKECPVCGDVFNRYTRPDGTLEPVREYQHRVACSKECRGRLRRSRVERERIGVQAQKALGRARRIVAAHGLEPQDLSARRIARGVSV